VVDSDFNLALALMVRTHVKFNTACAAEFKYPPKILRDWSTVKQDRCGSSVDHAPRLVWSVNQPHSPETRRAGASHEPHLPVVSQAESIQNLRHLVIEGSSAGKVADSPERTPCDNLKEVFQFPKWIDREDTRCGGIGPGGVKPQFVQQQAVCVVYRERCEYSFRSTRQATSARA
jgi:hypothetical protein